jgi:hypothetical protein
MARFFQFEFSSDGEQSFKYMRSLGYNPYYSMYHSFKIPNYLEWGAWSVNAAFLPNPD